MPGESSPSEYAISSIPEVGVVGVWVCASVRLASIVASLQRFVWLLSIMISHGRLHAWFCLDVGAAFLKGRVAFALVLAVVLGGESSMVRSRSLCDSGEGSGLQLFVRLPSITISHGRLYA